MPFEFYYFSPEPLDDDVPASPDGEYGHALVEPTDAAIIPNYVSGQEEPDEIILLACNQEDDGGVIHRLPAGSIDISDGFPDINEEDLPPETVTEEFDQEGVETPLFLEEGVEVSLRARYAPPGEITRHFQIPRNLIYPDTSLLRQYQDR